jgi:hypothetical protein
LLYHKVSERLRAIRYRSAATRQGAQVQAHEVAAWVSTGADLFGRHVRAFLAVAQSLGIEVVVPQVVYAARSAPEWGGDSVVAALWRRAIPSAPPDVVWRGYASYDSVARAAAASYGATYVPATDSALWQLESYTPGDPIHFNDRGSRRFGEAIAAAILAAPRLNPRMTRATPDTRR